MSRPIAIFDARLFSLQPAQLAPQLPLEVEEVILVPQWALVQLAAQARACCLI